MFEKLTLKNFQAHAKLEIQLSPAVTTIIGPSDRGKTAVLRALRWVCTNKPGGAAFVKHGTPGTRVTLYVDGHKVRRVRGKGNTYELDGKPLEAFGAEVPTQVAQILNTNEVCFQGQHDAPFWFSNTPGEVSRALNAIIDLGVIDSTLANLGAVVRKAKAEQGATTTLLKAARERKRGLVGVPALQAAYVSLEEVTSMASGLALRVALVRDRLQELRRYQLRAERAALVAQRLTAVVALGTHWQQLVAQRGLLATPAAEARGLQETMRYAMPDLKPIETLAKAYQTAMHNAHALGHLAARAAEAKVHAEGVARALNTATQTYTAKLGKRCPLCNQTIPHKHPK